MMDDNKRGPSEPMFPSCSIHTRSSAYAVLICLSVLVSPLRGATLCSLPSHILPLVASSSSSPRSFVILTTRIVSLIFFSETLVYAFMRRTFLFRKAPLFVDKDVLWSRHVQASDSGEKMISCPTVEQRAVSAVQI